MKLILFCFYYLNFVYQHFVFVILRLSSNTNFFFQKHTQIYYVFNFVLILKCLKIVAIVNLIIKLI